MKKIPVLILMLMSSLLAQAPANAGDDTDKGDHPDWRMMMHERQQMTQDVLGMMKETMAIIRNLNHKPSDAEKARLGEMMSKLDGFMEKEKKRGQQHEEMMEKRQDMKEQRMDMRDKHQEMMKDKKGM